MRKILGKSRYEIIDGERRWRASWLIPESRRQDYRATLIVADDDVIQYIISGITNFNREGHTPVETLKTIQRLREFGFPMDKIAQVLGISVFWARQVYGLRKLTPDVLKLLDPKLPKTEQLFATAAMHIAQLNPELQMSMAKRVISGGLRVKRMRGEVVRVGVEAGAPVRTHTVSSHRSWMSIRTATQVAMENARRLMDNLKNPSSAQLVAQRGTNHEIGALISQIEETIRFSEESLALLKSMAQKRP